MLLTPHLMAGAFTASYFGGNIFIAILVSTLTYFFVESIPHWDPENPKRKITAVTRYLDYFFSTIVITFTIYVLFQNNSSIAFTSYGLNTVINYFHVTGVFVTLFIYLLISLLTTINNPHSYIEKFLKIYKRIKNTDRSYWGIFVQFAIVIVSFAIIFRYFHISSLSDLLR